MIKNNFISKLHLGCSDEPILEKQNLIHFKDGKAYCTNGHLAIIQNLSLHVLSEECQENLEGKFIHRLTFKDLLSYSEVYFKEDKILALSENGTEVIFSYYKFDEPWIDIEDVFNKYEMNGIEEIGISPVHLKTVNDCLVKSPKAGLHFRFNEANKGMIVTTIDENAKLQKALLMPVAILEQ